MQRRKRRKSFTALIAAAAILLVLSACGSGLGVTGGAGKESEAPAAKAELTVSAAASLTDALEELRTAYEKSHPDTKLNFNFGASGALQRQIENGAPADLFLSAAEKNMEALVEAGLIEPDSRKSLLKNELVLVAAKDAKIAIREEADLRRPDVKRIAIGIPESVPAGDYAKQALTGAGLWESLQDKLVQAKDVRQVLQFVETGNADAGFVYKTDALTSDQVAIAAAVDPDSYPAIVYPAGIVKATAHPGQARGFYDFLGSEEAAAIFEKYGFSAAP